MTNQSVAARATRVMIALLIMTLGACTKRDTQYLAPWLRVHVIRPRLGEGMITLGERKEIYEIKRGRRWKRVGAGSWTGYMLLGEETDFLTGHGAALVNVNDGKGVRLLVPGEPPRPVPRWFGREGTVTVPPSERPSLDVFVNVTPRAADVYRYDLSGRQLARFQLSIPEAYSDCTIDGVSAYDTKGVPYSRGSCKPGSAQAKCLVVGPRGFVDAVPPERGDAECAGFSISGSAIYEVAHFSGWD